jgi:tetratricopeptide (TPR) repeat protein
MNCESSVCRWKEEEDKIKEFIVGSVGYDRTNKVVLAAIVQSCIRKAADAVAQLSDGGASLLHAEGLLLFDAGDYDGAVLPLEQALTKEEAVHGEEAIEIVESVYMLGQCHWKRGEQQKSKECYKRGLRVTEQHYGAEHVATARLLVGISRSYPLKNNKDQYTGTKAVDYCRRAIALIEVAESPDEHSDTHADALYEIGRAYHARAWSVGDGWVLGGRLSLPGLHPIVRLGWFLFCIVAFPVGIISIVTGTDINDGTPMSTSSYIVCTSVAIFGATIIAAFALHRWRTNQAIGYYQQSLQLRESEYGQQHITTADALRSLAKAYRELFQPAKAMRLQLQVLAIEDRTKGPLSAEAGATCRNIGNDHFTSCRFSQAATYFKRAVEANAFTLGRDHKETKDCSDDLLHAEGVMTYMTHTPRTGRRRAATHLPQSIRGLTYIL